MNEPSQPPKPDHDILGRELTKPVIEVHPAGTEPEPTDDGWQPVAIRRKLRIEDVRAATRHKTGRKLWRALDELADTPEFETLVREEFPRHHKAMLDVGRRDFMKMMGAGMALAGMTGCTKQPVEKIVPYVRPPEEVIPGKPLYFASAAVLNGFGYGILAESHMGRPTKLEGNPDHPASLGGTDHLIQASVLDLYDPDRSQSVNENGRQSAWTLFESNISQLLLSQTGKGGSGFRLLTGPVTSPTQVDQIKRLQAKFPSMKWISYSPVNRDRVKEGAERAFGRVLDSVYDFTQADVILSLGADFLSEGPGRLRYAHDFASRRSAALGDTNLNRLYVVETTPTVTGSAAEHRLPVAPQDIERFAFAVAAGVAGTAAVDTFGLDQEFLAAVIDDLKTHGARSLVVAGDNQPPEVHALAHKMNEVLGAVGTTVRWIEPVELSESSGEQGLIELVDDMNAEQVQVLVILNENPAYNAPPELQFTEALKNVPNTVHLSSHFNETSRFVNWHLPLAHFLTVWGDVRSYDGTVSLLQPTIKPLYSGKSEIEVMSLLLGEGFKPGEDIVKEYWKASQGSFSDKAWRKALHDGMFADTAAKPVQANVRNVPSPKPFAKGRVEVCILPDPTVTDGAGANNGWLQELPKPITTLTWDNPVLVSPALAEEYGLQNEDVVEITHGDVKVLGPAWISPGHGPDSITVFLGYGRSQAGRIGTGIGYNAYPLLKKDGKRSLQGASIRRTGKRYPLAATQAHHVIADRSAEKRNLIRTAPLAVFEKHPEFAQHPPHEHAATEDTTLYPGFDYSKGEQWGMAIDLNKCVGCNACIMACQAENNIPVVGKEEVIRGREMHWLRVDRYYEGEPDNPKMHQQLVACFHCENAPCEPVCPVNATNHSSDGLNQMVYNRCVGTRYCSNNCPYKVRRFNFFQYSDEKTESLKLQRNPDVTVRVRGVMEKCTYCVQRISHARIEAKIDERPIADGEVVTACQQACPSKAIAFGNINDPDSEITRWKNSKLNYTILSDLNTMPRTTHLAKVTNPNSDLESEVAASSHGAHAKPAAHHGGGH